jgi:hypothetical protein
MAIYLDCSKSENGIKLVEESVGKVISLREKNGYHDSDFFATYWCEIENKPKTIEYGTTRAYSRGNAFIDATEDVLKKYKMYNFEIEQTTKMWVNEYNITKNLLDIVKGDNVSIIRGRKHKGSQGQIIWIGKCNFTNKTKYGVAMSDKKDSKGFYSDVAWVLAEYCQKSIADYDKIKRRNENAYNKSGIAFNDAMRSIYSRR